MEMLTVKDVKKSFDGVEILKGISLTVEKGGVLAIIGPSGSGKSTLLRCITQLETVDAGEISICGESLVKNSPTGTAVYSDKAACAKIGLHIGLVFQNFNLFPHFSVLQNITEAPVRVLGKTKEEANKLAHELLEKMGLQDKADAYPYQLSGGQQQRVSIARALAMNPTILLCDEATSALDPTTTKSILALLKDINEKYGITIVIITHSMEVVQEICTHVAIIDAGELAENGTVADVFASPKSRAAKKLVFQGDQKVAIMKSRRCIRIVFTKNSSFEPVIANMVLECRASVNILMADTQDIGGIATGQMILQLPEENQTADKMIAYLREKNLTVEELKDYVE